MEETQSCTGTAGATRSTTVLNSPFSPSSRSDACNLMLGKKKEQCRQCVENKTAGRLSRQGAGGAPAHAVHGRPSGDSVPRPCVVNLALLRSTVAYTSPIVYPEPAYEVVESETGLCRGPWHSRHIRTSSPVRWTVTQRTNHRFLRMHRLEACTGTRRLPWLCVDPAHMRHRHLCRAVR